MISQEKKLEKIQNEIFIPNYQAIAKKIIDITGITSGICLDIGRGSGELGRAISAISDLFLILMDNSYNTLYITERRHHEKNLNHTFRSTYGDVQKIPLEEESINLVVSSGDIWLWQDKKKAISEIYRVITKGGFAYIGKSFSNKERIDISKIESTKECLVKLIPEMKIPFYMTDDESGVWFVLHK